MPGSNLSSLGYLPAVLTSNSLLRAVDTHRPATVVWRTLFAIQKPPRGAFRGPIIWTVSLEMCGSQSTSQRGQSGLIPPQLGPFFLRTAFLLFPFSVYQCNLAALTIWCGSSFSITSKDSLAATNACSRSSEKKGVGQIKMSYTVRNR